MGTQLPPIKGHSPHFWAHVYCGQTAGWIKMPLGTKVGLGQGHIVLDGDSARPPPHPKMGHSLQFLVHFYSGQTFTHLSYCWALVQYTVRTNTWEIFKQNIALKSVNGQQVHVHCRSKIYTSSFPVTSPNQQLLMAALRSRSRHYILVLFLLSSFPLPNLSGRRLHVYHISTRGVALVRISNAGLICAARGSLQMQNLKKSPKIRHLGTITQLCWAISLQLRHVSTIGKKAC